jgi:ATP-dependent helicase HrpB
MVGASAAVRPSAATDAAGVTVAFAFPERIARRRGGTARFVLAGGGGAELDARDPLGRSEWLAVAELDLRAGRGDARILSAVALDESEVEMVSRDLVTTSDAVEWDRQLGDVRAERRTQIGAIVLSARPLDAPADASAALLEGVRTTGLSLLPGWASTAAYRDRVAFCRATFGDEWPDLSHDALLASIDDWLAPWLVAARRRADLDRVDVAAAIAVLVGPRLHGRLDALAPTELRLPSGRTRRLAYSDGVPVLRLRVQDAFGWSDSPRVADGRVPVVLHLLSPADRPVQVTTDLGGFWSGSYAQVRAEMRGRYPKHAWPDDPASHAPRPA